MEQKTFTRAHLNGVLFFSHLSSNTCLWNHGEINNIQDSVGKAANVKQKTDDDKTNSPLNHE